VSAASINPLDKMVRNGEFKIREQAGALGVRAIRSSLCRPTAAGYAGLGALHDSGTLRPVIDSTFPFDRALEALAYGEQGRTKAGKVMVSMVSDHD
jgi:hypothetical protein